ncbi:uncharacterized protein LOC126748327 isoform X2 [Anthonomus grandis grandis]|uniref:uncharacterized protein LOC126748327 isoform X1 n=1 Tax=Anthonomus grandis grandis TaxID=2921223 RepID=UPI0021658381|nr:uncharacterized protein LOC126748327 isoform X1 [Anthonomus grandis grandis]XP_050313435.1 uncharacterized protein LOC126748327 isoform X2 [Anthonomus grandis grandis]
MNKCLFSLVSCIWIMRVTGSALHEHCETDDDCGTIDTVCEKNICVCRENFAVWFDSCLQLPQPRIACTKKHDCQKTLGVRSTCTKKSQCACKPFHHLHNNQCIKNRDLHESCDNDSQCYCGADCQEKIACIHKNCSCKAGHSSYKSRRCISDDSSVLLTLTAAQAQQSTQNEPVPKEEQENLFEIKGNETSSFKAGAVTSSSPRLTIFLPIFVTHLINVYLYFKT